MLNKTLRELSTLLSTKQISSVELTQYFLDRVKRFNPSLNAFITISEEKSLAQAREADARIAEGKAAPLTGIPVAQKDIFCADGWLTTCGSKMLENFISPYDAHVIEQFNKEGMIMLGKTNMDEFAMGSSNETSYFGKVRNPWDLDTVPGGSSGGAASAVAARLAPAATGTDTGGSIRQPAAFTGISGIKPTYGTVSRYGMIAFASSLDQAGPMAKSADDLALLLNVMTGFDRRDSTSIDRPKEDYTRDLEKPLKGLRIGLPREYFADGLDEDVRQVVNTAIEEYRQLGAEVKEVGLPNTRLGIPIYYVIAPAEASSNLSRFDGVRYGYRAKEYKDLTEMYEKTRAEGFGSEVKRRILIGTYVLSHGYYDAFYLKAQKLRRLIAQDFQTAFKEVDVVMGPTTPSTSFNFGEKSTDPVQMYLNDVYSVAANLAGLPGMSIPVGFDKKGRTVGLQISGDYFSEAKMLNIAHQYQKVTDWHLRMPEGIS